MQIVLESAVADLFRMICNGNSVQHKRDRVKWFTLADDFNKSLAKLSESAAVGGFNLNLID